MTRNRRHADHGFRQEWPEDDLRAISDSRISRGARAGSCTTVVLRYELYGGVVALEQRQLCCPLHVLGNGRGLAHAAHWQQERNLHGRPVLGSSRVERWHDRRCRGTGWAAARGAGGQERNGNGRCAGTPSPRAAPCRS